MADERPKADERPAQFVEALSKLERGDLARLRRNVGAAVGTARGVAGLFYRSLPEGIAGTFDEEIYFLVATLYGLNCKVAHKGDFGTTMVRVKAETRSDSIDKRMAVLLDSEFDLIDGRRGGGELAYRLRQLVKLAASHRVGVDWPQLIHDLSRWYLPNRPMRKQWAQSYYIGIRPEEPATPAKKGM